MQRENQGHQRERFINYTEREDKKGFYLDGCTHFFKYDEFGGWYDEHGNYYDHDGEPCSPPYESDEYDEWEMQYGPSNQLEEQFEKEIPKSQDVLEKISKNMHLLEAHDQKEPLRVMFRILNLHEDDDPPTTKQLFQACSEKVKKGSLINVFYSQHPDDDDEEEENQDNDGQSVNSEEKEEIKKPVQIQENVLQVKKSQQLEAEKQTETKEASQQKDTQIEKKLQKEEEQREPREEPPAVGYFVVKNLKAAEDLIHLEGEICGQDFTFDVEPINKLIAHPLKKHEKQKFVGKYLQFSNDQGMFAVTVGDDGFDDKKNMHELLGSFGIKYEVRSTRTRKDNQKKVPIIILKKEDASKIEGREFEGKVVKLTEYNRKEEQEEEGENKE